MDKVITCGPSSALVHLISTLDINDDDIGLIEIKPTSTSMPYHNKVILGYI